MSLQKLALYGWRFGLYDDWAAAAVALSWVTSLDLECCDVTDEGVRNLSQHMVHLTTLRMLKCPGVSEAGWVAMAAARPEGQWLELVVPHLSSRVVDMCEAAGQGWVYF